MLSVLGLTELQELVYRQLVAMPSAAAEDIADELNAGLGDVSLTLESLESLGLVARSVAKHDHFIASPPELALGSLIVERQQDIRQAELELHALTDLFHKSAAGRVSLDVIDVVRGPQAVAQHFAQLQRGAKQSVWAMVKPDVLVMDSAENVDEAAAIARGVNYRVIIESQALNKPGFAQQVATTAATGEEIRVTDALPLRMLIADQELALLPLSSEGATSNEVGALLLRRSGLLDAMCALFELCWQRAQTTYLPAERVAERPELDGADQHLLVLLRAGLTDKAIAGQLGTSLRTVQRRLQLLMTKAEVATRFQLGVAAASKEWL
ncbi:helix-turn-helix domain-containing protein [Zhihengliuella halotolerans]|uniref:Sugar-specific transcriptional regulator TrmB n=1 Tax=Zhihengliuella halotolerans TaxID=370736 RepID=A0A4Q8AFK1_9MICC|nr:helix-turn-helix domain-containing protein [Zhihengliuella halotolerans]RZU62463.1 sugar-specific transcriptional regulator TrmB [Zhihengliuella halotolerans]